MRGRLLPYGTVYSREELGVVVLLARLELLPPLQEGPERGVGLLVHDALVPLRPHLQADQGHADVQGPVELHYPESTHIFFYYITHNTPPFSACRALQVFLKTKTNC